MFWDAHYSKLAWSCVLLYKLECADTGAAAYCEFVKNNDQCGDPSFSNTCLQTCEMC